MRVDPAISHCHRFSGSGPLRRQCCREGGNIGLLITIFKASQSGRKIPENHGPGQHRCVRHGRPKHCVYACLDGIIAASLFLSLSLPVYSIAPQVNEQTRSGPARLSTPLPNPVVEHAHECLSIGKRLRTERWIDAAGSR